jgi:pre-mRNA-processing factor 17
MSLVPARNGANRPPPRGSELALDAPKTSTRGKVPTGYAEEIIISEQSFRNLHREVQSQQAAGKKRKRENKGASDIVYGAGAYKGPWAKFDERRIDSDSGEEVEVELSSGDESDAEGVVVYEEDAIAPVPSRGTLVGTSYEDISADKESSKFEGSAQYDYQGRTYMHVPQDLDVDLTSDFENLSLKCYHPKKLIHTYRGGGGGKTNAHDKALTQLKFFPSSGHLLLSSAADGRVKLWDAYHDRELLRSYSGHTKSVVDVDFSPDGTHFLTASYDRQMKIWDTETGTCTGRYSTGSTPHVVRWHPENRSGGDFIAGMHDNKIVQFDPREPLSTSNSTTTTSSDRDRSKPTQTYDHHLGPVNTLTFSDENRRFISTSDDKSLRAWDYNIPVPVKLIAEPHLFPLVASAQHPNKPSILYQSADNTIQVYNTSAEKTLRANRKKEFRGHNTAGYAISLSVSPDGGIVCSGDAGGYVCFWDWKTCKLWHKFRAGGDKGAAVVATAWHPRESSKVVTGDIEGVVRYWD